MSSGLSSHRKSGLSLAALGVVVILALYPCSALAQVELTLLSPATIEALPRAQATATYRIVNTGASPARVRTSVQAPEGWGSDSLPQLAEVAAGHSEIVFVSLLVPASAQASSYPVELVALDAATGAELRRFPIAVQVARVQSVSARSEWPESASAVAGQTITQTVLFTNLGNAAESLTVSARSSPEWPVTVTPAALTLAGGQSSELTVSVTIPTDVSDAGDLHLMFIEARAAGATADQPPIASIVNRTRVVLGARDARIGPVYGTFAGDLVHRLSVTERATTYDTRLALVAPLGEGRSATIEAQSPALAVGENNSFAQEHFRVAYDDLRRGFFHAGDISVDLDQPLLFYSRSGRGYDVAAHTGRMTWRNYYIQDRFGLGLISTGAQIRRRIDRGVVGTLAFNHERNPGTFFNPVSDQANSIDYQLVLVPDARNELRLEGANSDSRAWGGGQAHRVYARTADRGFYAIAEHIAASENFAGAYRDENQTRVDASLPVTSDLRPWVSYSFHEENPGWNPARTRTIDETARAGVDWTVFEDTQLRFSRTEQVTMDSFNSPLGNQRNEHGYEFSQRWGDFRLQLGADIGALRDRDLDRTLESRRYRVSTNLEVPRGYVSLDYYRDLNPQSSGTSILREDYFLRSQLRIAKLQDLRADLRYSPGGFFGESGSLTAEWRLGRPERWKIILLQNFGFSDETAIQAEYHQLVRMPFKAFPVGGIISGRIYRLDNGEGIPNARLIIDGRSILADESGVYGLRGVTPGEHVVELDIASIGAGVTTVVTFPQSIAVAAGETATLDIPVTVSASIAGTVTQTGATNILPSQPLAGAIVELRPSAGGEGQLRQTDSMGRYRFGEVAAGDYTIAVRAGSLSEPMDSSPGEQPVSVGPGEQVYNVDFLLKPKPRQVEITIEE